MKSIRLVLAGLFLAVTGLAKAGSITDYGENKLVDALLRGQAIGAAPTVGRCWQLPLAAGSATLRDGTVIVTPAARSARRLQTSTRQAAPADAVRPVSSAARLHRAAGAARRNLQTRSR